MPVSASRAKIVVAKLPSVADLRARRLELTRAALRLRREHPALHWNRNITFHNAEDENFLG